MLRSRKKLFLLIATTPTGIIPAITSVVLGAGTGAVTPPPSSAKMGSAAVINRINKMANEVIRLYFIGFFIIFKITHPFLICLTINHNRNRIGKIRAFC
jgi:hypothetical protein